MARGQEQKQSSETQIAKLVVLIALPLTNSCSSSNTPHQPYVLTGMIYNAPVGDILQQVHRVAPTGTWYPNLIFDLQDLVV